MNSSSIIFILFAIAGAGFLIFHALQKKLKKVVLFDLPATPKLVEITKAGTYAISIIGVTNEFRIDELQPEIIFENNTKVPLKKILFSRINWKGQFGVQKWHFYVSEKGTYELVFPDLTKFIHKNPTLTSRKPFSDRTIITKDLTVLISK